MDRVLRSWGLSRLSREQAVFAVWNEAVGELAAHARPVAISGGRLVVAVADNVWMQQLQFMKDEVRGKLNRLLGASLVKEVRFRLASALDSAPAAASGTIADGAVAPPPLAPALEAEARAAADRIADPRLREQVLRALLVVARHPRAGGGEPGGEG